MVSVMEGIILRLKEANLNMNWNILLAESLRKTYAIKNGFACCQCSYIKPLWLSWKESGGKKDVSGKLI